jgi:hypothetical protein
VSAALSGPYLVAAALLAVAGAEKLWHPDGTRRALVAAGWPAPRPAVRLGGALEAALGVSAALVGGPLLAAGVAASYLLLSGFVLFALTRGTPLSSCGCFGQVDTPPTIGHLTVNLVAAAVAAGVAAGPTVRIEATIGRQPLLGVPFVVLAGTAAYLVYLMLTSSARLLAVRRGAGARGAP